MSGTPFAKEEVMEAYLSSLLHEAPVEADPKREQVAKLLESASPISTPVELPEDQQAVVDEVEQIKETLAEVENKEPEEYHALDVDSATIPEESFQALFFEVAGLKMAVPLTSLGGIHQLDKIGPLFGKPAWFKGVMLHRDEKLSVVDTARWVMPEKYDEKLAETLNYQYLIMLDNSDWGLACERLVTTATLAPEDVKWREAHGKRPWLAGMVKEKMCALVNVRQLIAMLDQGLGSNEQ
ncbi:chemotaxis protein CheW [Aestuariibacter halophilus]|uniref:Chemotaxis protein CheW n=1 Tax=Fluctibacter halophilus TaxID=226011 RepID=A0ABS8G2L5_9ALTE|nr:chemotaxis protein CheW [Aestuariibacter halophilus]MCC2614773.1 chemotaxis protein CheW [Aestuariibacter halophilus]